MKKLALRASIALGIVAVGWLCWRILLIEFTEDLYCSRGSFEYYLTIRSPLIRETPLVQIDGIPQFYYSCGDGPKPAANGIQYSSSATPELLEQALTEHISRFAFDRAQVDWDPNVRVFQKGETKLELSLANDANLTRVRLTEMYFY